MAHDWISMNHLIFGHHIWASYLDIIFGHASECMDNGWCFGRNERCIGYLSYPEGPYDQEQS